MLLVVGVIGYFALSGIGNALVYYLTPTELLARGDAAIGASVGVVPGFVTSALV